MAFCNAELLCNVVNPLAAIFMSASIHSDLHCHSHFSDGSLSPEALLSLAQSRGVNQLAITDHDTVKAYSPALAANAAELGVRLISGCELSCQWQRRGIHVIGLNMNLEDTDFRRAMLQQAEARGHRAEAIARALARLGFTVDLAQVQELAAPGILGRPHVAKHLVATGQQPSMAAAFKRVLGDGKAGDIKANWPELETVVGWIVRAGGVAVLAHPLKYKVTLTKLRGLLDDFKQIGGQGIEVITGHQEPSRVRTLSDLASRYDLHASMGSDFHTPSQPWADLGRIQSIPEGCKPIWQLWS